MEKIDFKKQLKELYKPSSKEVSIVNVPKMNYLMIDGKGNPGTSKVFQKAIEALFSVSYNLKFFVKKNKDIDYGVLPLEGLWWADNMEDFVTSNKENWQWKLLIMQPDFISEENVKDAISEVEKKKALNALPKLRFESYDEGRAAQIMHIGPFSEEGPTIQKIHKYIEDSGHKFNGDHHEIYLNDIRRVHAEKMKTILRQPITNG